MPFKRVVSTRSNCFICYSREDLHDVPFKARMQVFIKKRIFIPRRNTCCSKHLLGGTYFFEEEIMKNIHWYSRECFIESSEWEKFLSKISDEVDVTLLKKIGNSSISEERVRVLTGVSWEQLTAIRKLMINMRDSENRTVLEALVLFLLKLRSGNYDRLIWWMSVKN